MPRLSSSAFAILAVLALSACKSPEERAEEYFVSAQELLETGDVDRAVIELRNVFRNDEFHREARQLLANTLMEEGRVQEAFGQYLRLVEQYPDDVPARLILAEIALEFGDWETVQRHGAVAIEKAPDLPRTRAIALVLAYRDQVLASDSEAMEATAQQALSAIYDQPDNIVLRRVAMGHLINTGAFEAAMPHIEKAIALRPENEGYQRTKLGALAELGDAEGVGGQLRIMVELFPEDVELKQSLLSFYIAENDFDSAEAFLRAEAGDVTGPADKHIDVLQFLMQTQGLDAARAEAQALEEANAGTPNADFYRAYLANIDFQEGNAEIAIAALEEIIAGAEPSDQTRRIAVALAQMLNATGDRARAEPIINGVLEVDPAQVDALKLRAGWLIVDDRPGEAILALRTAQGQAPQDVEVMTLLAAAFERDGNPDLVGEQLARAVEASGAGVDTSLRYARFLRERGRVEVAETVLLEARRAAPNNLRLLSALAEVFIERENWVQVREIAALLATAEEEDIQMMAQRLEAAALLGQNQLEEGLSILQQQAADGDGDIRAVIAVVMTQLRSGQTEEARAFLDTELAKAPQDPALRLMSANLNTFTGRSEEAEVILRGLLVDEPDAEMPVRMLFGVLGRDGRLEEARALLADKIETVSNPSQLLLIQAGLLERDEDFEGAIGVYERLYALNSSNVVVANNLASMISTYRDDAESLDRAYAIARRLRAMDVPAFQDTFGWIEYRRGNLEEALPFLEAGAAGLPDEPLAQFHLGMILADLGRTDEAKAAFERVLSLSEGRALPQVAVAEARLVALKAGTDTPVVAPSGDQ
jgi:tetratricopeptide (TPR) repeat protein